VVERSLGRLLAEIQQNPFSGAWRATAVITASVAFVSGILMRITDPDTFENVWQGWWWAAQTVSTVGYGDILPTSFPGRLLAVAVMAIGVTFLTVTSAAIASAFIEAARRRRLDQGLGEATAEGIAEEVRRLSEEVRRLREDLARAGVSRQPPPEP
jgi:voltage-gated potassium channel